MGALAEKLRKLPGNVRGVLGYTFFSGLAGNMYRPLVVPFFRGLGLDSAVVGAFMALQSGFSSAASVTGGFLGDWLGRRRLIMAAKLMAIVYLPVLILMRSPSAAAVVFVLMGLEAIGSAPFTAIMADCTDESNRGTFMGIIQTISWTMQMLVPLLGGVLADTLGPKAAFGVSLPLVLASMVSLRVVASSRKASETASVGRQAKQVAQGIWRPGWRRSVAGIAGMEFFNGISNGVINLVLPYYLMDRFGAGFTGVSAIGVSVAVGTVLVVGGAGRLADRIGRRPVIVVTGFASAALLAVLVAARAPWQIYGLLFLLGAIGNAGGPAIMSIEMESVGAEARSTFSGLLMGLATLGSMVGAVVGGILYKYGFGPAFMVAVVTGFIQATCIMVAVVETAKTRSTGVGA